MKLKKFKFNKILIAILAFVAVFSVVGFIRAATWVNLLTADHFAILAGSGITNSGATTINGDIGTHPTLTETGFGSIILTGTNHVGDGVTQSAKNDLVAAYNNAAGQGALTVPSELGTTTKTAGVYDTADGELHVTGTLTLDGGGDPDAVFIFKAGSTLTTSSGSTSHVSLINSAQACNVFWQVGSSATIGTGSDFKGNILALSSITDDGGSTIDGRLLARDAAVTLNNTTVSRARCAGVAQGTLHIIKHVITDNGGSAVAADSTISVTGTTNISSSSFPGSEVGVDVTLDAGSYSVDEGAHVGYTKTLSADCSGIITAGATKNCTITNDDIGSSLTLNKTVVNTGGGTKLVSDFPLYVDDKIEISGVADSTLGLGLHPISESGGPSGYNASAWSCVKNGGAPVEGASVVLGLGDTIVCGITNTYIIPPVSHSGGGGGYLIPPKIVPTIITSSMPIVTTTTVTTSKITSPIVTPGLPNTGFPPEDKNSQSQIFFFISSIGFIILGILAMIILVYFLQAIKVFSRILQKVEKDIDSIGDTTKEMLTEVRESSVFNFIFRKKSKHKLAKK